MLLTDNPAVFHHASPALKRVAFILGQGFSLLAYSAVREVLELASQHGPAQGFTSRNFSALPTVTCDQGMKFGCSALSALDTQQVDVIIVCGGRQIDSGLDSALQGLLPAAARQHKPVAGLCSAVWHLAAAGLLDERRYTLNAELVHLMQERFARANSCSQDWVGDGAILTCANASGARKLAMHLLTLCHGEQLAWHIHQQYLQAFESEQAAAFTLPPYLKQALALMSANIEDPLSPDELASLAGISRRQLERAFEQYLGVSPGRYYLALRLNSARLLLTRTHQSVTSIALATGFVSSAHFSTCFSRQYRMPPGEIRRQGNHLQTRL